MGAWQEIVDYTVPSNTTSVVLDNFGTITKNDFVKVVATFTTTVGTEITIHPNNDSTTTNYWRQILLGNGTSVTAGRTNTNQFASFSSATTQFFLGYIKLSENDKFNLFLNRDSSITSSLMNIFHYLTSTSSFSSGITSLTFTSTLTNGIATGSRIQIYKLAAEKIADVTVTTNSTQVNIPIAQEYALSFIDGQLYQSVDGTVATASNWMSISKTPIISNNIVVSDLSLISYIQFWNENTYLGYYGDAVRTNQLGPKPTTTDISSLIPENATHFSIGTRKDIDNEWTTVTTTFVEFTNLEIDYIAESPESVIDKDSEYLLVSEWICTNADDLEIYPNDLTTRTAYYTQGIFGQDSSAFASRINSPRFASGSGAGSRSLSYVHIKLSNIGAFTAQSYNLFRPGTTTPSIDNWFISSTAENITSITKLNIVSKTANQIIAGSRFELYKLYE